MWRSKPSQLRTWLQRWKRVSWFQHLSGRILKPSQWKAFEEKWTSSLEDTLANPSQSQEEEKEQKTLDTFSHILKELSNQLSLPFASLRMSKDTFHKDSITYKQAFEIWVTQLRQDCSQRLKLVRATREKGYLSWATPTARDCRDDGDMASAQKRNSNITSEVRRFPVHKEVSPEIGKIHDLNPDWVEQMMGIPTSWTAFGSWGTE